MQADENCPADGPCGENTVPDEDGNEYSQSKPELRSAGDAPKRAHARWFNRSDRQFVSLPIRKTITKLLSPVDRFKEMQQDTG
jgi:hypothetical protein